MKLNNLTKPYIFNNFEVNKKTEKRIYPHKSSKYKRQLSALKIKFLEYYAKLPIQKLAAESIGKSEDWVVDQKKKDTKFAHQIASAKSAWALYNASLVKSKEWLLERVMKDHFAEKKEVEHEASSELQAALDRMASILPRQK